MIGAKKDRDDRVDQFIKYLFRLSGDKNNEESENGEIEEDVVDRAALADLRCGFHEATEIRAWARIGAFCPLDSKNRIVFQTVGAGYATNPNNDETPNANFGDVARKLSEEHNSFEIIFRRILACKTKRDVCNCLRGSLLASKAKDIPVPWKSLLWDLLTWENPSRRVKEKWAARYWYVPKETEEMNSDEEDGE